MHIRRRVSLRLCPTVSSPMLMGLLHPVILLPDEELTTEELALVLRHELTHLKRGDLLVKAGLVLAYALHWYNPVVWAMGPLPVLLSGGFLRQPCYRSRG